jgi:HD-like signal output (HDOD) protein
MLSGMKSLLILLLSAALLAAAFFTRPSPEDCQTFLAKQHSEEKLSEKLADFFGRHKYAVKDNYLWVEVQKDGKPVYVGAFGHFFERNGAVKK